VRSAPKIVIVVAIIGAILYVLISPIPEPDATSSIKSALLLFVLVVFAQVSFEAYALIALLRASVPLRNSNADPLSKSCVRIC
jgi:hypothetical protein